ncbi:hypothetical protein QB910_000119 [Dabrowskivirus KKP3916]|uniref:Uncharacterized protein n=1 Tax=Alicyclobacillus phage KKP_3916 TaxID=3040651 RepID=A0AAT9V7P8_9CAUD|nr:hypothetical protein QB910_000119 [Alicyclobacillus phage KKP 3916]
MIWGDSMAKKSKNHDNAVKNAYTFRKLLEEERNAELASKVEETYKELWCECLNEKAPWT